MSEAPYPFNDDLLVTAEAQAAAKQYYGVIYEALYHPELIDAFRRKDKAANEAKRKSRQWGLIAVALVTVALLLASSESLIGEPHGGETHAIGQWIAFASGVAGALGTIIGCFGVLFADSKRHWLESRLTTERLRQFHFQSLLALAPEIEAAVRSNDWTAFKQRRAAEFLRFREDVLARIPVIYDNIVNDGAEAEPWLFAELEHLGADAEPVLDELLAAYRRLRIDRQVQYASYKLQRTPALLSNLPLTQARFLDNGALACVLGLVLLHCLIIVGVFAKLDLKIVHVVAIWVAIVALALRTAEEGLKPHREVERYRDYRSALRSIDRKFAQAPTGRAKLEAMADIEVLTYDEMLNFIKSNHDARFVM